MSRDDADAGACLLLRRSRGMAKRQPSRRSSRAPQYVCSRRGHHAALKWRATLSHAPRTSLTALWTSMDAIHARWRCPPSALLTEGLYQLLDAPAALLRALHLTRASRCSSGSHRWQRRCETVEAHVSQLASRAGAAQAPPSHGWRVAAFTHEQIADELTVSGVYLSIYVIGSGPRYRAPHLPQRAPERHQRDGGRGAARAHGATCAGARPSRARDVGASAVETAARPRRRQCRGRGGFGPAALVEALQSLLARCTPQTRRRLCRCRWRRRWRRRASRCSR